MPSVVVQIEPDPPPALARAAIDGCDGALGAGRCQLVGERGAIGDFYAIVHFEGEALEVVRVEFRRRSPDGVLLEVRELHFTEQDTARARSTSVGVVIAALAAAHERRTAPRPAPPIAKPRPPEPKRLPSRTEFLRLDVGATAVNVLEESPLGLGAQARGSLLFEPMFVMASFGYERKLDDSPRVTWLVGGMGMGVRVGSTAAPLAAELRTELVGTWLEVAAEQTAPPRQESDTRLRFGPRLGLDAIWAASTELGLVMGVQGAVLRPAVTIDVGGQTVERAPAFSWGGFLGLRWAPRSEPGGE
jgi:hypothetical protein